MTTDVLDAPSDPTPTPDAPAPTPDWRASLPDELRAEKSLESFRDVGALAKSYVETKRLVGAKPPALKVPDASGTAEDWTAFRTAMGVPESADKYGLTLPEVPGSLAWDEGTVGSFLKAAWDTGVPPFAAQKLVNWYAEHFGQMAKQAQDEANAVNADLRREWGVNYDANLGRANRALQEFGGDELVDYLIKSGLGRHPLMVKAWSSVGNALVEHGAMAPTGTAVSAEEAMAKINAAMSDPKHPAMDASNPNHEKALEELLALRRAALGRENQVLTTI